jgi:hypothetical protein
MATVRLSSFGPKRQFVGTDGLPLSGYWLFFYVGGSVNTKQNTYTDSTGTVANPNPIQLNSLGEVPNEIYFVSGSTYKAFLEPPDPSNPSVPIDPPTSGQTLGDFLQGINDTSTTIDQWITGPTPTFLNATQFTLVGDQTSTFHVGRRLRFTVTAGTVYGTITASAFAALTTITVSLDSGALDSGLSSVFYGIISSTNTSLPLTGGNAVKITYPGGVPTINSVPCPVRQTVLSGPVDASGFSAFGGATGTTTVTAAGTLIVAAANGFSSTFSAVDRVGSIVNPSWTGLSTNGTMYLYLDIAADGTCTTGSGTLVPVYQWGGAFSTTSGQFTFNIQQMTGQVGNGATAAQTFRVYVGEVTVAGAVVTAITWYQILGRYSNTQVAIAAGTPYSFNSNLGVTPTKMLVFALCKNVEGGYSVGDRVQVLYSYDAGGRNVSYAVTRNNFTLVFSASGLQFAHKTTGIGTSMTAANWSLEFYVERGW